MTTFLVRFGAVSGVLLSLSIGIPGIIEVFTGEITATSTVLGLGTALGAPAVFAYFLAGTRGTRYDRVALVACSVGTALFSGVAYTLNIALVHLDPAQREALLAGPTGAAFRVSGLTFMAAAVLFGIALFRDGRLGRVPAASFAVALPAFAFAAPRDDTLVSSALHVVVAATFCWLSINALRGAGETAGQPTSRRTGAQLTGRPAAV